MEDLSIKMIKEGWVGTNIMVNEKKMTITGFLEKREDILSLETHGIVVVNGKKTYLLTEGKKQEIEFCGENYSDFFYKPKKEVIGRLKC